MLYYFFEYLLQFWRNFPRRRETQWLSKKDRELFCCVSLRKHGRVSTGLPVSNGKVVFMMKTTMFLFTLSFPSQRRWPTAGSTTSSRFSCLQTVGVLSPRRRGTSIYPKWKLRMQGTTPALFPAPSLGGVSSPNLSPSSPYPPMMVSIG